MIQQELSTIKEQAQLEINSVANPDQLEAVKIKYLGRKSRLTEILRNLKDLPNNQRPEIGRLANQLQHELETMIQNRRHQLKNILISPTIDPTLPGIEPTGGHSHPITQFINLVNSIFGSMGFEIVDGPEVEIAKYNFDLLNIPADHPARDLWDTYYVKPPNQAGPINPANQLVMRTHTSPVQIRVMLERQPPVRLIVPGRVFRHEATDASHESVFYQCEGLVIDQNIKISDLIGTLRGFIKAIFGPKVKIRVRPEYYPFVEPGLDIDMGCILCGGRGCSVCGQRGWLEMLGSGMVHPQVLKNMKVDPEKYSGFAFGLGLDRLMMLYHKIQDIRLSYLGDLRFLYQF